MKFSTLIIATFILLLLTVPSFGQTISDIKQNPAKESYISLAGQLLSDKNQIKAEVNGGALILHLNFTKTKLKRGTILLLSGNSAELPKTGDINEKVLHFCHLY